MKNLVFTALLALWTIGVHAQRGTCGIGVSWELSDNTLTISGNGEMSDFSNYNRPSYDIYKNDITQIIVQDGITRVGSLAFLDFTNLQQINFKEGLITIGDGAFQNCKSLTTFNLPQSLETIEASAFFGCSNLATLTIPKNVTSIGVESFYGCEKLKHVIWNAVDVINDSEDWGISYAFGHTAVEEITFGDEVVSIPAYTFQGLPIKTINTSGSIEYIGHNAFYDTPWFEAQNDGMVYLDKVLYTYKGDMTKPTEISIQEGTVGISDYAFSNQRYLTKVIIPSTIKYVGSYAFNHNCPSLGEIVFNATECTDERRRGNSPGYFSDALSRITFGEYVLRIPSYLLYGCSGLQEVILPNNLTSIGNYSFDGCGLLSQVTLPESLETIGSGAFQNCTSLSTLTIPENVSHIDNGAFWYTPIETLYYNAINCHLGYSTRAMGGVFNADALKNLIIGDKVEIIPSLLADGINLTSLTVGESVKTIEDDAFINGAKKLNSLVWKAIDIAKMPRNWSCNNLSQLTFGNKVTRIPDELCLNARNLKNIELPSSVTTIGEKSFSGTGIKSISIPDGVTQVGAGTFQDCTELIEASTGNTLEYISPDMFYGCTNLTTVSLGNQVLSIPNSVFRGCTSLQEITIPNKVASIGNAAFENCSNLKTITFGENITIIGNYAFRGCENLETVNWNVTNYDSHAEDPIGVPFSHIVFGERVTNIPPKLCQDCTSMTSVTFPPSVKSIGEYAFDGCSNLANIDLQSSLYCSIGSYAFRGSAITSLFLPPTVGAIGQGAFADIDELSQIIFATTPTPEIKYPFDDPLSATIYATDVFGLYELDDWKPAFPNLRNIIEADTTTFTYNGQTVEPQFSTPLKNYEVSIDETTWAKDVGNYYPVKLFAHFTGEHNFQAYVTFSYNILPAVLTASVKDTTIVYGEQIPDFKIEYTGFVANEDESVIFTSPEIMCNAQNGANAGSYLISLAGGHANNYIFSYIEGFLTIKKAQQYFLQLPDFTNLHVGDSILLDTIPLSSKLSLTAFNTDNEEVAAIRSHDGQGTFLVCMGTGLANITLRCEGDNNWEPLDSTFVVEVSEAVGIHSTGNGQTSISTAQGRILVKQHGVAKPQPISVFAANGTLIRRITNTQERTTIHISQPGIYIIKVGKETFKISVR